MKTTQDSKTQINPYSLNISQSVLDDLQERLKWTRWPGEVKDSGWNMGTNLAYGVNDSPVGFAAWIIEKFRSWSDCAGNLEKLYPKDELLTNIMLYWVNGPSVRAVSYREEWVSPSLKPGRQVDVPVGLAHPPKDLTPIPPREFAARSLKNIQHWTVLPHGGHFAAWEYPEPMAQDIQAFFHDLKTKN